MQFPKVFEVQVIYGGLVRLYDALLAVADLGNEVRDQTTLVLVSLAWGPTNENSERLLASISEPLYRIVIWGPGGCRQANVSILT